MCSVTCDRAYDPPLVCLSVIVFVKGLPKKHPKMQCVFVYVCVCLGQFISNKSNNSYLRNPSAGGALTTLTNIGHDI